MSTMIAFTVDWDAPSKAQFISFQAWDVAVGDMLKAVGTDYGEEGRDFIRDHVKGNGYWGPSTGETAAGIDFNVKRTTDGVTVEFLGRHTSKDGKHNVANMIDVGNFSPGKRIFASTHGLRAFPIGGRLGRITDYLSYIHGMGHTSPEYPKYFSEDGVSYLLGRTPEIIDDHIDDFFDRLVIT